MSDPFIAEIRMFGGTFAPKDWAFCNGQLIQVTENPSLYSLVGTNYGGDGRVTFGLPDLRGRAPMHAGTGSGLSPHRLGELGGVERVGLDMTQTPSHSHEGQCRDTTANQPTPVGTVFAQEASGVTAAYVDDPAPAGQMKAETVAVGGAAPHNNMAPFLAVNFIICLVGTYPSRN